MFNLRRIFKLFQSVESEANANNSLGNHVSTSHCITYEAEAVVTLTIAPGQTGQIKFQGSWWTARCLQGITLIPGMLVHVIGRQTITLYVEPMFSNPAQGD